jgi:hypothetical protein
MKRALVFLAAVSLFAAMIPGASASSRNATSIERNFGCQVSSRVSHGPFLLSRKDQISVTTSSGNTVLQCRFRYPSHRTPTETFIVRGFRCNTFLGLTRQTRFVGTTSGVGILTCLING